MRRRDVIAMLGAAAVAWPRELAAQAPSNLPTNLPIVGVLWPGRIEIEKDFDTALRAGLQEGGYVEGKNFAFAMRYANADVTRLTPLAEEIAALKPRVVLTSTDRAVVEAHRVMPSVPLVMGVVEGDPVAMGLAQSYSHPGGMVTGMTGGPGGGMGPLVGKGLGLLKELAPGISRLGLIITVGPSAQIAETGARNAASRLGIEILPLPVHTLAEVENAFASGVRAGADSFYVDSQPLMFSNRDKVAQFATHAGKPTMGQFPEQARAGLLTAYSFDIATQWHTYGTYTAKILAGAKPGDLPIEQPSTYRWVVNLKTAKALGLAIPPTLLTRVDEVIE